MNYEKITKTQARKMHAEGKAVYVTASKVNPYSMWISPYEIPKEMEEFYSNLGKKLKEIL